MADSTTESALKIPFAGEFMPSPQKKFNETIVLVPFFGGVKRQLRAHSDFLLKAGFDTCVFQLQNEVLGKKYTLIAASQQLGMKHIWADQIEAVLNALPGEKIIYGFSSPSASAIEAIARRHAIDVRALICDSGPSGNMLSSTRKYLQFEKSVPLLPARWALAFLTTLTWSPNFRDPLSQDLSELPEGFRILSIRGWRDKIISANEVDQVFERHSQIDWQKLSLPQASHLNGLRDFPSDYVPGVLEFLNTVATRVST